MTEKQTLLLSNLAHLHNKLLAASLNNSRDIDTIKLLILTTSAQLVAITD
jgi:hypothetical protein